MSPTGSGVSTVGPQLVLLFGEFIAFLEEVGVGFECTGYFSVAMIKSRNQKQLVPNVRAAYPAASGQIRKLRGHT